MDTHPKWLQPSKIPLTIVCGPPCSGKTTYVRNSAVPGDVIIDLDQIRMSLSPGFRPWSLKHQDEKLLLRAMRVRNMKLGRLCKATQGSAWFIVGAPSQAERDWWQAKLGGLVVLMNPGLHECRRRAYARGTPLAAGGVDAWEAKSMQGWHCPAPRKRIRPDGWFTDDVDEADIEIAKALAP
jgi:AAA domain-containing protein